MAMLSSIGRIFKPIVGNIVKAVAPKALDALKGLAGKGISSLFEAGTKGLQGLASKIPFLGPTLSNLIGKYAPGLQDAAKNWASGQLDRLLGQIMGTPTSRPLPGAPAGTTITPPPQSQRAEDIVQATPRPASPTSNTNAQVGNTNGASTSENATMSNLGWSGGPPDPSKYKMDTPEGAAKFQQDNTRYQQTMNNIQLMYSTLSNTLAAMASTAKAIGANVRI
ncbi:MAG: hypothetical protein Q8N26_03350 [Myxococcales bacterium]|nr:hypothetical protein [Myxococcales bacterium]